MVFVMNMKKLMILVALLCGISSIGLYAMEEPEESENPAQKEKETEEGGLGVKREREPERTPVQVCPWQPPRKRIKTVKSLAALASEKFLPYAIQQEDFPEILKSIPEGSDVTEFLRNEAEGYFPSETLLHRAANALEVRNLLELGTNLNAINNKGQTVINALIAHGNIEGAYYLLERFKSNLDISTPDQFGVDPLQNAIIQNDSFLVKELIIVLEEQHNLRISMRKNKNGHTALDLAVQEGLFDVVPLLIRDRQDPVLQLIFHKIMDKNKGRNEKERNRLQIAFFLLFFTQDTSKSFVAWLMILLQQGVNINAFYLFNLNPLYNQGTLIKSLTLLMYESIRGFLSRVKLLLENGANISSRSEDGETALFHAIINKNEQIVYELLKNKADANSASKYGITPMMYAARFFPDSIPLLFIYDAQLEARDDTGLTAIMYAIHYKNKEAVELLLDAGADVNARNNDGETPIMYAARFFPDVIGLLLLLGARKEDKDEDGNTALILAVHTQDIDAIKLLLEADADVNEHDTAGVTPLMVATEFPPNSIMPMLLKRGARLEDADENGDTALMLAVFFNNEDAVKLLLEVGANVNARNNDGETVLEVAKKESTPEIIALIEAKLKEIPPAKQEEEGD
jgi:ankyrin repeat protein